MSNLNFNLKELTEENVAYANEIVSNTSQILVSKSIAGERMTREEKEACQKYFEALNLLKKAKKKEARSNSANAFKIA